MRCTWNSTCTSCWCRTPTSTAHLQWLSTPPATTYRTDRIFCYWENRPQTMWWHPAAWQHPPQRRSTNSFRTDRYPSTAIECIAEPNYIDHTHMGMRGNSGRRQARIDNKYKRALVVEMWTGMSHMGCEVNYISSCVNELHNSLRWPTTHMPEAFTVPQTQWM